MPLQVDATLCYAKDGCPPVPVEADKKIDSPYNTYKVLGLPPTPIATVSQAAIHAALHPAAVDYLYYVSDQNGKTYFATTLPEHERNIARARAGADAVPTGDLARAVRFAQRRHDASDPEGPRRADAWPTSSPWRRWCSRTAAASARRSPRAPRRRRGHRRPIEQVRKRFGRKVARIVAAAPTASDGEARTAAKTGTTGGDRCWRPCATPTPRCGRAGEGRRHALEHAVAHRRPPPLRARGVAALPRGRRRPALVLPLRHAVIVSHDFPASWPRSCATRSASSSGWPAGGSTWAIPQPRAARDRGRAP